jgi:TPR repeat protein
MGPTDDAWRDGDADRTTGAFLDDLERDWRRLGRVAQWRPSMAFMQWLGLGRERAEEEALKARVTSLQTALAKCKEVANSWTGVRRSLIATIAVLCLTLGFALGAYRQPIEQAVVDLATALGLAAPTLSTDTAESAYENGNYQKALRVARPLAEQGDARAQMLLGRMYSRGNGVPVDEGEAVKWIRRAADQGNPAAQFGLGNMYAQGKGVPQDTAEAAKWYRAAADRGDPHAQYNLGLAYAKGEGLEQDNISAHMWFNIAASRFAPSDAVNRNLAISNREVMARKLTPEEVAEAQRRARDWASR